MLSSILKHFESLDEVLSRTSKHGTVDTSVSSAKKPALKYGSDLSGQIQENRKMVAGFVDWQRLHRPRSHFEMTFALITIAHLTGEHLLPEGIFRTWNYESFTHSVFFGKSIPPEQIPQKLFDLGKQCFKLSDAKSKEDQLNTIALIEWELAVGPLHPFYDGCGRISRYYSTLLSLWCGAPVKMHQSRDEYFSYAREGGASFAGYYLRQPNVCLRDILAKDIHP
jgi:hypothetical protein